jgi:hypothetical protein
MTDTTKNTRGWKLFVGCIVATNLLLCGAVLAIQLVVDPFGAWNLSPTPGFNHRKSGQAGTERLFKLYEFVLRKPRVVFLGNSRAAWGLPATWYDVPSEKVYNLSFDAQRLGDARPLLAFMLARHRPKTIVLNLDTIMMTNKAFRIDNLGGFDDRLSTITASAPGFWLCKLRDTVFSLDALYKSYECYKNSKANLGERPFFENGWFVVKGGQLRPKSKDYRNSYWRYFSTLHKLIYPDPTSMDELYRFVDMARQVGVELVISFAPIGADYLLSIDANDRTERLNDIKRQIAAKVPFWDFSYVNSITINRFNYVDATHYRGVIGEIMLRRMSGDTARLPEDFGVLVTARNINAHLQMTASKLAIWKEKQQGLYRMLRAATQHQNEETFKSEVRRLVPAARPR